MTTSYGTLLTRASRAVVHVEQWVCSALIVTFGILLIINVILRYAFNSPLFFAEELGVYILIWMAFMAISIGIHHDSHVRLTMLTGVMPDPLRAACYWVSELICLAILALLLKYSLDWVTSPVVAFDMAITLGWDKWVFYLIIPLFSATSLLHITARLTDRSRHAFPLGVQED
ncbi:TRAP transporter small permease [Chromohalobacter nigrandesensis]|uniref:TRAP transporter small permease n=1 Tax=Chromohalobacter nigrandesensis TaxID=119863 RepID=UPI001FF68EDC|nr:TRAP transporter small permease [Chromohalobacter nigrandesensis]MCK0745232.1 TRAP transporter small permease [Chromohalobacter nigrandesensis]